MPTPHLLRSPINIPPIPQDNCGTNQNPFQIPQYPTSEHTATNLQQQSEMTVLGSGQIGPPNTTNHPPPPLFQPPPQQPQLPQQPQTLPLFQPHPQHQQQSQPPPQQQPQPPTLFQPHPQQPQQQQRPETNPTLEARDSQHPDREPHPDARQQPQQQHQLPTSEEIASLRQQLTEAEDYKNRRDAEITELRNQLDIEKNEKQLALNIVELKEAEIGSLNIDIQKNLEKYENVILDRDIEIEKLQEEVMENKSEVDRVKIDMRRQHEGLVDQVKIDMRRQNEDLCERIRNLENENNRLKIEKETYIELMQRCVRY